MALAGWVLAPWAVITPKKSLLGMIPELSLYPAPIRSMSLGNTCGWSKAGCSVEASAQTPEKHC